MKSPYPTRATIGILAYTLLIFAVIMGMSHGLAADSVDDARINTDDIDINQTDSNVEYDNPVIPDRFEPDTGETRNRNSAVTNWLVKPAVHGALWVADKVSLFAYHNQGWISAAWANALLQAVAYAGMLVYAGVLGLRVKNIWENQR